MKLLFVFVLILLNLWLFSGCKKEMADPMVPIAMEIVKQNAAPTANAGLDQSIILPINETVLKGSASDPDDNIKSYKWEQVGGPSFCIIQNGETLTPRILNLEIGAYEFELTVTDSAGLFDKDKVMVNVATPDSLSQAINDSVSQVITVSETEFIITNLQWIFPWYSNLRVDQFHTLVPLNTPISVFIKRDNSDIWVNVPPSVPYNDTAEYVFSVYTTPDGVGYQSTLDIVYYGLDTKDTPSIKIKL